MPLAETTQQRGKFQQKRQLISGFRALLVLSWTQGRQWTLLVQTKAAHIKICAASIAETAPESLQTQKSANTNKHKIGPPETLIYQRLVITFNIIQPSTKRES
jgi:hypothetical protein